MLSVKTRRLFLQHTWTISRNSSDYKDNVFVRFEHDGVTGLGESAPNVRYGENAELTTKRIESFAASFREFNPWLFSDIKDEIFTSITDQNCARCGIDIALIDWVGKKLGVPLYRMWGLNPADTPLTSYSIGIDTSEMTRTKIEEAAPYKILKIKLGLGNDEEIMKTVRSVTDKPVRVDANEGWKTREEALAKINWLETLGVEFIEQPMPAGRLEDIRWLRDRVNLPLVADEDVKTAADIPKLADAYDGINIKLMKAGGLQESMRMIQMARALGLRIMLGCMVESSIAITAAAHLSPLAEWADLDGNLLLREDPFSGVGVEDGKLILPDKPGLGISGEF